MYYSDNLICYSCRFPCKECSSVINCTSCVSGTYFHLSTGSCLFTCPMGTFYQVDSINQCIDC